MTRPAGGDVLVVDDDPDVRESLLEVIEDAGYRAAGAAHGRDALDRLRGGPDVPSLILLDLMMPEMDGWAFRREQLADPDLAAIPTVVLTAHRDVTGLRGADCVTKPIDVDALIELVARHCGPPRRP